MNISDSILIPRDFPILGDPNQSDSIKPNAKLKFRDFSHADERLNYLRDKGFCDEFGNPTKLFGGILLNSIPKSHPIYESLLEVINLRHSQNLSDKNDIFQIIEELKQASPQPITDVQIIGSELWRVLFKHPDILSDWIKLIFDRAIDKETLNAWTEEFLASRDPANNPHAGKETDIRIVCPTGTSADLAFLSNLAKGLFYRYFDSSCDRTLSQFSIIKDTTTLVGFDVAGHKRELIITNKPNTLSSDTCFYVSLQDPENLIFDCLGFNFAKVLIDFFCKIYTPFSFDNPQAWIRLMYNSDRISAGNGESKMVESLFKPFESIKHAEDFIESMQKLGYKPEDVQNYVRTGSISTGHEEVRTLYLYFLIKKKMRAKMDDEGKPPSCNSNALFLFRCCQSLLMYGQLSHEGITHLIQWLNEDDLLIYTDTHAFLTLFVQNALHFPVISAMTTLAGWIEQPETFTRRQEPYLFFLSKPFTLRIPIDLPVALEVLQNYLQSNGNPEILKSLYACLITDPLCKTPYQEKLCKELHLTEDSIKRKTDFLLKASDPFIRFLGMQIHLIFNNLTNDFFIFEKLPDLLQLDFKQYLDVLYKRMIHNFKISEDIQRNCYSLSGWIRLFIESNQREYVLFAYGLWKKNIKAENKDLDFQMLNALSQVEPRLAIKLLREQSRSNIEIESALKIISNISNVYPVASTLDQEIYPLIEKLILDPATDQRICRILLKVIADRYKLNSENFNSYSLNDWIKLLAQTQDLRLVEFAYHAWKENRPACQPDMDLKLLQALILVNSELALPLFSDLYFHREPPLEAEKSIIGLKLFVDAYQNRPQEISFKLLIPILNDLLKNKKSWNNTVQKNFMHVFNFFIEHFLEIGFKNFSASELASADKLLVEHHEALFKIKNWNKRVLSYLAKTPAEDRPHLYTLFSYLLNNESNLPTNRVLCTLAKIAKGNLPDTLPQPIINYINSNNPISIFKNSGHFVIAGIYIRLSIRYGLFKDNLTLNIWQVCLEQSRSEGSKVEALIKFLDLRDKKIWQDFFTTDKDHYLHLKDIPPLIKRFFKEIPDQEDPDFFKWTFFLILLYIQSSLSKEEPLAFECSEDAYREFVLKLLSRSPPTTVKKYLLLKRHVSGPIIENAAKSEIEKLLKAEKIDTAFCLDLAERYFPNNLSVLVPIIKTVTVCKDNTVINQMISALEKVETLFSDGLAAAWIFVLKRLKELRHVKIWQYLESLPKIFDQDEGQSLKNIAERIVIEGACMQLPEKTSHKHSLAQSISKQEILFRKTIEAQESSYDLFLHVFCSFTNDYIQTHPREGIILLTKEFDLTPTGSNQSRNPQNKLWTNLHRLKEAILRNFDTLTDSDIETYGLNRALLALGLINPSKIDNELICLFMRRQINLINQPCSDGNEKVNYRIFFNLLAVFTYYANFQSPEPKQFLQQAAFIFGKIYTDYKTFCKTNDPDKNEFLLLLNHATASIIPKHSYAFHSGYFVDIFDYIDQLQLRSEYTFALQKYLVRQLIEHMHELEATGEKVLFAKAKHIFEVGMNWLIKKNYGHERLLPDQTGFEKTHQLLSLADKIQNYAEIDLWLYISLGIATFEYEENVMILGIEKFQVCEGIVNQLIDYNTPLSMKKAIDFFNLYLNYNSLVKEAQRLKIFQAIINVILKRSHEPCKSRSFFKFLYSEHFNLISSEQFAYLFGKAGLFYDYNTRVEKILFTSLMQCINNLYKTDPKSYMLAHYVLLATKVVKSNLKKGQDHYDPEEIPSHLAGLLNYVIHIEEQQVIGNRFREQIEKVSIAYFEPARKKCAPVDLPCPSELVFTFMESTLTKHQNDNEETKLNKFNLIKKLLIGILSNKADETVDMVEKRNENVIAYLFAFLEQPPRVVSQKNYDLLNLLFTWLEKRNLSFHHQIYFKITKFHFETHFKGIENEKSVELFEEFCNLLAQIPQQTKYWTNLITILNLQITHRFKNNPQDPLYRKACLSFVELHLQYFEEIEDSELKKMSNLIPNIIFTLREDLLLDWHEPGFTDFFPNLKEWYERKKLDMILIELIELHLKVLQMDQNDLMFSLKFFMPNFAYLVRKEKEFNLSPLLFELLDYLPSDKKNELRSTWDVLINPATMIIKCE